LSALRDLMNTFYTKRSAIYITVLEYVHPWNKSRVVLSSLRHERKMQSAILCPKTARDRKAWYEKITRKN